MRDQLDLVVLVADADAEWTLRTLLEKRTISLQIRPIRFTIIRHPDRDAGTFLRGHELVRPYLRRTEHALIVLDREGSGREHLSAQSLERQLEDRLRKNGWIDPQGRSRAAAIVLDPELEVWVWSSSPHVADILGLDLTDLHEILSDFSTPPNGKPERPKEAMLAALRRGGRPHSASIFQELAEKVSLRSQERAFSKLRDTLQAWFPMER